MYAIMYSDQIHMQWVPEVTASCSRIEDRQFQLLVWPNNKHLYIQIHRGGAAKGGGRGRAMDGREVERGRQTEGGR